MGSKSNLSRDFVNFTSFKVPVRRQGEILGVPICRGGHRVNLRGLNFGSFFTLEVKCGKAGRCVLLWYDATLLTIGQMYLSPTTGCWGASVLKAR